MAEPCLWCWEIRNTVDGTVVKSSWTDEALAAANNQLRSLTALFEQEK